MLRIATKWYYTAAGGLKLNYFSYCNALAFYCRAKDDVYGKTGQKPYVLEPADRNKTVDQYTGDYGYYGAKREAELEYVVHLL